MSLPPPFLGPLECPPPLSHCKQPPLTSLFIVCFWSTPSARFSFLFPQLKRHLAVPPSTISSCPSNWFLPPVRFFPPPLSFSQHPFFPLDVFLGLLKTSFRHRQKKNLPCQLPINRQCPSISFPFPSRFLCYTPQRWPPPHDGSFPPFILNPSNCFSLSPLTPAPSTPGPVHTTNLVPLHQLMLLTVRDHEGISPSFSFFNTPPDHGQGSETLSYPLSRQTILILHILFPGIPQNLSLLPNEY